MSFYVCTGSAAAVGPIMLDELALRRREGSIVDASLVWSESDLTPSSEWLPLATCTALLAALDSVDISGDPASEGEVEASPRLRRTVVAAFDYEGDEADGEISFAKGDRIQMAVDPAGIDDGWWSGLHELSGTLGLFPANYVVEESAAEAVASLDAEHLTAGGVAAMSGDGATDAAAPLEASVPDDGPPAKARSAYVMEEIATTERRYVSDVTLLRDTFVNPIVGIRAASPTGSDLSPIGAIVTKHDAANGGALLALFAQVEAMANLNAEFLVELDRRKAERPNAELAPIDVCAAFDAYLPFFKLYAPYMNGFKAAMESLDGLMTGRSKKEFVAFCEPRGGSSKFMSLLIKPVQRIPRYRLLLEELRKQHGKERAKAAEQQGTGYAHAEADATVDAALAKTIDMVKGIAAKCNAGVEEHAARQVILQLHRRFTGMTVSLVPSRRLVRQGLVFKTNRKGGLDTRRAILFSDLFILAHESSKNESEALDVRQAIPLTTCRVTATKRLRTEFNVLSEVKSVRLLAPDDATCSMWVDSLRDAIAQAQANDDSPGGRARRERANT